jgi:hypothetical protein
MESTTTTGTKGKGKTELQTGSKTTNMNTRFALCGGSRGHLRWTPSAGEGRASPVHGIRQGVCRSLRPSGEIVKCDPPC